MEQNSIPVPNYSDRDREVGDEMNSHSPEARRKVSPEQMAAIALDRVSSSEPENEGIATHEQLANIVEFRFPMPTLGYLAPVGEPKHTGSLHG